MGAMRGFQSNAFQSPGFQQLTGSTAPIGGPNIHQRHYMMNIGRGMMCFLIFALAACAVVY